MIFLRSSARHPCPCCGRTKTSHCAWSLQDNDDDVILCHDGERFGPPPGLALGDVITLDGRPFALTAVGKGFAGRSHVFRPHRPLEGQALLLPVRLRAANQELVANDPELDQKVAVLLNDCRSAFEAERPHLQEWSEQLQELFERCRYLLPLLRRAIRTDPTVTPWAERMQVLLRDLRWETKFVQRCLADSAYHQSWEPLAPTALRDEPSDWEFWGRQKAQPTHPWVLEQRAAEEAFWFSVDDDGAGEARPGALPG